MDDLSNLEAEEGLDMIIKAKKEIRICEDKEGNNPASIVNMIKADDKWYIQDKKGRIYVMDYESD
jgi:hypothetical protein